MKSSITAIEISHDAENEDVQAHTAGCSRGHIFQPEKEIVDNVGIDVR